MNDASVSLSLSRRRLLAFALGGGAASVLAIPSRASGTSLLNARSRRGLPTDYPAQDPELVRSVVGKSHFDLEGVKNLVTTQPELAKASWDWGFGDWESALGAASHVGRREIAELLIAHGARPNLFTYAMLGKLDAVRAMIEAQPGVQRIPGPHGITLLAHARFGGEAAQDVHSYLDELGDADPLPVNVPIGEATHAACLGTYQFVFADGEEAFDAPAVEVSTMRGGAIGLKIGEGFPRGLSHQGDLAFHPAGAPSVRIAFERATDEPCRAVTIRSGDAELRWMRSM